MGETWVILAHPDAVVSSTRSRRGRLGRGLNMALRPLLRTSNVLLLDGRAHLRRRKLVLLPPLHGERMRSTRP